MSEDTFDSLKSQFSKIDFSPVKPFLATIFGAPLLRIQTILQTQDVVPTLKYGKQMKGVINCIIRIKREEGFRFLWRGAVPAFGLAYLQQVSGIMTKKDNVTDKSLIATKIEENGINKENIDKSLSNENISNHPEHKNSSFAKDFIPIAISLAAFNLVAYPLEVIRTRLSADFGPKGLRTYKKVFQTGKSLVKAGGTQTLYNGFLPLTMNLILRETLVNYFVPQLDENPINIASRFGVEIVLYPLVVIANRMMMISGASLAKYQNLKECVLKTKNDLGLKGFYNGFQIYLFLYGFAFVVAMVNQVAKEKKKEEL